MLKIFAAVLLATSMYAGAANARGGGAETMPATNFTDLPPYRPQLAKPRVWIRPAHNHVRWHQSSTHGN
jgi:hypothetical protein